MPAILSKNKKKIETNLCFLMLHNLTSFCCLINEICHLLKLTQDKKYILGDQTPKTVHTKC